MKTLRFPARHRAFIATMFVFTVACVSGHAVLGQVLDDNPQNSFETALRIALVAAFIMSMHSIVTLLIQRRFWK